MEDPRYPVGPFNPPKPITIEHVRAAIDEIAALPTHLRNAVKGLDAAQLDTRYRDGGWTVRQVVHHIPDSHMNAYIRMKLAVAENHPTVKPYDEAMWAEFADAKAGPVEPSLQMLDALHDRWVRYLRSLDEGDFKRALFHPQYGEMALEWLVLMYGWHSRHHVAHITSLRRRMNWG